MKKWWVPGMGRYFARRPAGGASVVRAAWRLRREHWWRQRPWLPLAPEAYWDFRMTTVNGYDGHLDPAAVVSAARWSLRQHVGK